MTQSLVNHTHDPALRSWVESANSPGSDFPIQNLPHGVFRRRGSDELWRGGMAIGDSILDVRAALNRGLFEPAVVGTATDAAKSVLNDFMALPVSSRHALRSAVSALLAAGHQRQTDTTACLLRQDDAELALPARIENFSDFYSSLSHATRVGALFRPDNPILPNYRWLPVGYHGRTSSIRVSGQDFKRPLGQTKPADRDQPVFGPCQRLDYEAELGLLIGAGTELGDSVPVDAADSHIFGVCLLNDWSARDIQTWEYQPLGPFLSKSFLSSLSPWVVTLEALEPFRAGWQRPAADPPPMPHLNGALLHERGSIDIRVQVWLQTQRMREAGWPEVLLSTSNFTDAYWTMAQLVAHQTSNGCNLCPGDLLGSGTLSGPDPASRACLLELTNGGKEPIALAGNESRKFLEDGDTIVMRAYCERDNAARIGFGECRTTVLPSRAAS